MVSPVLIVAMLLLLPPPLMSGFFTRVGYGWVAFGRPFPLVHLSNSNGVVTSLRHIYMQCGCCRASQCAERDALHMVQRVTAEWILATSPKSGVVVHV